MQKQAEKTGRIDVCQDLFAKLQSKTKEGDWNESYNAFEKKDEEYIKLINNGKRIVYPPVHQELIYELRKKYGIPTFSGFVRAEVKKHLKVNIGISSGTENFIYSPCLDSPAMKTVGKLINDWKHKTKLQEFEKDLREVMKKISKNLGISYTYWINFLNIFAVYGIPSISFEENFKQKMERITKGGTIIKTDMSASQEEINDSVSFLRKITSSAKKQAIYDPDLYFKIWELCNEGKTDKEIGNIINVNYASVMKTRQSIMKRPEWKILKNKKVYRT